MMNALGVALLSLSIMGFGFAYNKGLKCEKESVDGLILLTERIYTRIKCFRQDLSEIYVGFTHPFLDSVSFTQILRDKGMSGALENCGDKLFLGRDIMTESKSFASHLGKTYYDEQLTLCEDYLSFLKTKRDIISAGIQAKTKLSISLSFAISALSAILFI